MRTLFGHALSSWKMKPEPTAAIPKAGVKKSQNFHLSPGQDKSNFYLSCGQLTCPNILSNKLALNFSLVRRTLGENICIACPA